MSEKIPHQTQWQIFRRFLRFGFLAWGGPVAQIAMIREELIEQEKWLSREKFNRALAVYQALPGPEAHELCVYLGMTAAGRWGGFLAGLGFMLPGFLLMLLMTWLYISIGIASPQWMAVFAAVQAVVIALIVAAVHRIGKHALTNTKLFITALFSLAGCIAGIHFLILLPAAGLLYSLWNKGAVALTLTGAIAFSVFCLMNFSADNFSGNTSVTLPGFSGQAAVFISGLKAGLLTFGGAYTVIPFLQDDAVNNYGWMTQAQFLDGIALSGILPAPLIIFSTFIGYFGGGWTGAVLMTVAIFLPSFSFTLLGHSALEKIIENKSLKDFLDGVTAAVIGLIAFTAIGLFITTITGLQAAILFAAALSLLYLIKSKYTVLLVIGGAAIAGLIINWFA